MKKAMRAGILGVAAVAVAATVQAEVININFTSAGRGSSVGTSYFMNGTANSMPTSYPGATWNDFVWSTATQNTTTNLLDTLGGATGVGVALSGGSNYGSSSIGLPVLKEYRYFSASGIYVTLSGLGANGEWDVYFLSQGNANGRSTQFQLLDATSNLVSSATAAPADFTATTWTEGGNYVKLSITADASGKALLKAVSLSGNNNGSLNGMQLVDLSAPGQELYTSITPAFGTTYVTNLPTIEVAVTNGTLNVDAGSFTMELAAGGTTNDVTSSVVVGTPASGVTTFSYAPVARLQNGTQYTVLYSVAGIGGTAANYVSSFTTAPDVLFATTPATGSRYVATDAEVSVIFTNVAVSLSDLYVGCEMVVNSNDVSGDVVVSYPTSDTMKFEYAHGGLAFSQAYALKLNVFRTDGHTNVVEFSFASALDPAVYLIAPGIRNGGFELVNGVAGNTGIVTDWLQIDDWNDNSGAGAKTEAISSPTEGTRVLVTGNGSKTYNITTTTIGDGDIFEYKWTIPGRANGVSAGLVYFDGADVVIVSNTLKYVTGGTTPFENSGSYLFDASKEPNAIGKQVGIIFIDDNAGSGNVYIDEVRLYYGNIAVKSVSPAANATGVASTAPVQVVIAESGSQIDTNSIVLKVDGVTVTTNSVISDTVSNVAITYTPAVPLSVGVHFVSVTASGTPAGTVSQSWKFFVDPTGSYLIGPNVRNGSFELVNGVAGSTASMSDWSQIDDWSTSTNGAPKTEVNILATDGSRIFVTGTGSETYNMTATTIKNGDRFGYSVVVAGRSYGVTAALAYMDGANVVVVSNSATFVTGGTTPFPVSKVYTFSSTTDPNAIGKTIGVIIIDDGTGSGSVQIDDVRLYTDSSVPTESPVIEAFSMNGSTVTLSWTTQNLGLYSLQSNSDLLYGNWVTVVSNMPAGNLTTNVPVSGATQEFFRIISQ